MKNKPEMAYTYGNGMLRWGKKEFHVSYEDLCFISFISLIWLCAEKGQQLDCEETIKAHQADCSVDWT